jgi:hypothetical protein
MDFKSRRNFFRTSVGSYSYVSDYEFINTSYELNSRLFLLITYTLNMLYYVTSCYAMLCYVMLCYVMLCYVMLCYVMLCYVMLVGVTWWCIVSRHCATSRKVEGSIPDCVIGIFHSHKAVGGTMTPGSTQPLKEVSNRHISWG